jgi:hypothetical protein
LLCQPSRLSAEPPASYYALQSGGFPLKGFSMFQSLLHAVASAFFTFFAWAKISIYALMIWNDGATYKINFADSRLYVGFPAGVVVLLIALPYFLTVWFQAKMRR